jgi:hypothetical protein
MRTAMVTTGSDPELAAMALTFGSDVLEGTARIPKSVMFSAGGAVAAGALLKNPTHALIASVTTGAVMPFLTKTPVTSGALALSMVTSTILGAISHDLVHHSFTKTLEAQREKEAQENSGKITAESFRSL